MIFKEKVSMSKTFYYYFCVHILHSQQAVMILKKMFLILRMSTFFYKLKILFKTETNKQENLVITISHHSPISLILNTIIVFVYLPYKIVVNWKVGETMPYAYRHKANRSVRPLSKQEGRSSMLASLYTPRIEFNIKRPRWRRFDKGVKVLRDVI